MIIPKPIRKIVAVFRGGVSPVLIVLSVAMGFWCGLTPGWSGLQTALLIGVLVLNVNLGLFLMYAVLGKALSLAAAPVLYYVGQWVQEWLSGLLGVLSRVPIVGMTDFSRYAVAGSVVIGPVVGVLLGLLLARVVIAFRRGMLKLQDGSETYAKWSSKKWVRVLDWLLLGKSAKDVKSALTGRTKLFRKAGIGVAVVILIVLVVVVKVVSVEAVRKYAASSMSEANGAEVNLASLDMSTGGRVSITGLEVTDPDKPSHNQVAAAEITAEAGVYDLTCGKVVIENLKISELQLDSKRETVGEVIGAREPEEEELDEGVLEKMGDVDKLTRYFENAKAVRDWLMKVKRWLPESDAGAEQEDAPHRYLEYLKAKTEELPTARLLAKNIVVDSVPMSSKLFGTSSVTLKNISDAPQATGLPVSLEIRSQETGGVLRVVLEYGKEGPAKVGGGFENLDLSLLQQSLSSSNNMMFEKGIAAGSLAGTAGDGKIDIEMKVKLTGLKAKSSGKGLFGLDAATASQALDVIDSLDTTLRLVGPVTEPRLVIDTAGLGESLKAGLAAAGKKRLMKEVDKQLGDVVPKEVGEKVGSPDKLLKGIGGLLGGKDKDEKEDAGDE